MRTNGKRVGVWVTGLGLFIALGTPHCRARTCGGANLHPAYAERAISLRIDGDALPSGIRSDRADGIECRRISHLQWRRHGDRHRDIHPRRRNGAVKLGHSYHLYGQ